MYPVYWRQDGLWEERSGSVHLRSDYTTWNTKNVTKSPKITPLWNSPIAPELIHGEFPEKV